MCFMPLQPQYGSEATGGITQRNSITKSQSRIIIVWPRRFSNSDELDSTQLKKKKRTRKKKNNPMAQKLMEYVTKSVLLLLFCRPPGQSRKNSMKRQAKSPCLEY